MLVSTAAVPDTTLVGKIYKSGDSIFYPIIASVTNNRKISGYLVRWRLQTATPEALKQLSQLLGTNAQVYVGNRDGSLWTDLLRSVEKPPVELQTGEAFFEYSREGMGPVLAAASPVPGTEWITLVEFSENIILTAPARFLKWIIMVGAVIVLAGFLVAWFVSRRITRPLDEFTQAASSVASGNYSIVVPVKTNDELGKLAIAFNAMTNEVRNAKEGLEQKVQLRTGQLEAANSELEAFSYSVSHDLRAPLRSINSYANILYEDYATKLDDEAIRLTNKIISNGKKMGLLIDDLISFSQIARKEIKRQIVNMQELVKSCEIELLGAESENKYRIEYESLPPCIGDEGLLRQVWINLISNAIKYSSKKPEPRIEIGCTVNGETQTYFVRDNGAGFDMKYIDKLFGVFQRLHSNKEFEGSGIGLALTKRIINRHKGQIYAEGKIGDGACFYFSLSK
ncbi:MAG: ATP-binding protein [Bacteroidota bacterium]